jgi:DNA-binding CsgD family transcriptional regulator
MSVERRHRGGAALGAHSSPPSNDADDVVGSEDAVHAGHERQGLRQTMRVIHDCIDSSNNFVGAEDDDVSPETARSVALLMDRLRRACDVLESQMTGALAASGRHGVTVVAAPLAGCASALAPRERQVARLLVDGYSNVNVAALCGVSSNTVRTLIRRVYRKLGVCNRAELVREMLRMRT